MGVRGKGCAGQAVGVRPVSVEGTGGVDDDLMALQGGKVFGPVELQGGCVQFGGKRLNGGQGCGPRGSADGRREQVSRARRIPKTPGGADDQDLHLRMRRCRAGSGSAQRSARPNRR